MTKIFASKMDLEREINGEFSRLQVAATSEIYNAMDRLGLSKRDLARKMSVPLDYLSGMLDGDMPITMKMLVRFSVVLEFRWDLKIMPINYIRPIKKTKEIVR